VCFLWKRRKKREKKNRPPVKIHQPSVATLAERGHNNASKDTTKWQVYPSDDVACANSFFK